MGPPASVTGGGSKAADADDATVRLAGPSPDEAWTSVVGEARPPEPVVGDRRPARKGGLPAKLARATPAKPTPAPVLAAPPATASDLTPPTPPVRVEDPLRKEAKSFFVGRCAMCHGEGGRGDGPTGRALNPQPRNFTDRGWQSSVTDAHIERVILNGGPSVGKSPLMPAHGDLGGKPDLVRAIRQIVRDFGR